ncbi:MAG TPA: hypothetical protein VF595_08015 [Tepidisphaeraceae bacterium]
MKPWEVQKFEAVAKLIRDGTENFQKIRVSNPRSPLVLTFGRGDFRLELNRVTVNGGGGDWTLMNPVNTIARLPGGHGDVGFYPNPTVAIWKTVERLLFARNDTIVYANLARIVLAMAERVTTDLKAVNQ